MAIALAGVRRSARTLAPQLRGGGLDEHADLAREVLGPLEALVDRGEAHVGHVVDAPQRLEGGLADLLARRVAVEQTHVLFHPGHQGAQDLLVHRTVLRRRADADQDLGAVEGLALARALHHVEADLLDALEGRVALLAGGAFAPTTDGDPVLGQSRVDHPVVVGRTVRTAHDLTIHVETKNRRGSGRARRGRRRPSPTRPRARDAPASGPGG